MPSIDSDAPNGRRALIAARLLHVRDWLDSVLDRIPPDAIDWAPAEGMRTIGGQLVEIVAIEVPLVPRLTEGRSSAPVFASRR